MKPISYNLRTLRACAKRLRHVIDTAPDTNWTVVWRFQEGYRLQIEQEIHEVTGWITHSSLGGSVQEVERGTRIEDRADEIAKEALFSTIKYNADHLDVDQLRILAAAQDMPDVAALAQTRLRTRTERLSRNANQPNTATP
jgi:hypothetical protein